jgi:hypothetical protein
MDIASAPSLASLVAHVEEDLRGGRVVFIHLPPMVRAEAWEDTLVDAIQAQSNAIRVALDAKSPNPALYLHEEIDAGADSLEEALQCPAYRAAMVALSVDVAEASTEAIECLLLRICRLYANPGDADLRHLVIFCHGTRLSVATDLPAVQHYDLWNPLRWQDLHALATAWLDGQATHPLMRGWQVATYVGASAGDPFLLQEFCIDPPRTLVDVRAKVERLAVGAAKPAVDWLPRAESRWKVPDTCRDGWQRGTLLGATIERGAQMPWDAVAADAARAYAERLVWQEQVSSLMPPLMEFTHHAARWLERLFPGWTAEYHAQDDTHSALEPGKIRGFFLGANRRVPAAVWTLLSTLRDVRNDLAHRQPVDAVRIAKLWSEFCDAQERFGRS